MERARAAETIPDNETAENAEARRPCEAIGPKTLELASREQVRVLVEGRLLPEAV